MENHIVQSKGVRSDFEDRNMLAAGGHESVKTVVTRIVSKIADAFVDPLPSENIFLEDVFPTDLYDRLLLNLPAEDYLDDIDHGQAIGPDGRRTRKLLDLTESTLVRLKPEDRPFWQFMIKVLTAPEIAEAIVEKFHATLSEKFEGKLPELVAVPLLYRDYPGYRIGIHPDIPAKIATMQFYLPSDNSQAHLGTSFHWRGEGGFEELKTHRFLPNSAYAFVRTENSWHSVKEMGPSEVVRNSIALTFYVRGQEYRSKPREPVKLTATEPQATVLTHGDEMRRMIDSFVRRDDIAALIRRGGVGVELGVAEGDFSERILRRSEIGFLFSIDMWAGDRGHDVSQYKRALRALLPYKERNSLLRMRFDEALDLFQAASLDFIYVDGYAHTGEEDGKTFVDWYPKLRPGGIIAGDDYHKDWPKVVNAVNDFIAINGLELHVINCREDLWNSKYPTWFAFKPEKR